VQYVAANYCVYEPNSLITVAIMNNVAKNPKDAIKPTPESIASFRLV
jgi:hypothetical protein